MPCLLCNYAPNEPNRGDHLPGIARNEIYVCQECVTRAKTVTNFGLTVDELKKAAKEWKTKWEVHYGDPTTVSNDASH